MIQDLETKGYVVIPNFLNCEILTALKNEYAFNKDIFLQSESNTTTNKYKVIKSNFKFDLDSLILDIGNQTNLRIGKPYFGEFFDNQLISPGWHQDHGAYFEFRDLYNAINCWIPIIKEKPNASGLTIVPHDIFAKLAPDLFKSSIEGKGAKSFSSLTTGKTLMKDDVNKTMTELPFCLDDIAITPELKEGDLLLLRQDIIHRTQDSITPRVAISVRCHNKNAKNFGTTDFKKYIDDWNSTN